MHDGAAAAQHGAPARVHGQRLLERGGAVRSETRADSCCPQWHRLLPARIPAELRARGGDAATRRGLGQTLRALETTAHEQLWVEAAGRLAAGQVSTPGAAGSECALSRATRVESLGSLFLFLFLSLSLSLSLWYVAREHVCMSRTGPGRILDGQPSSG